MNTVAKFVGCVEETCKIGGSISLRGIYEIPHPDDGSVALYERHTSQILGMGWKPTSEKPTHGRVWGRVGRNFYNSKVEAHVLTFEGPETVEVKWRPRHEVLAANAACILVGRSHIPSNLRSVRFLMEPACTVKGAIAPYTPEKFSGWSLDDDTGHGATTPCPDISAQVAQETERVNKELGSFSGVLS